MPEAELSFVSYQQLLDFQFCFSFSEANCWTSLASFTMLLFGGNMTGLTAVGSFKCTIPCGSVSKEVSFSFQRVKFRIPWDLSNS